MGGIQGREGSLAEVHAVRGGQLILRVAPKAAGSSFKTSGSAGSFNRTGSFKAAGWVGKWDWKLIKSVTEWCPKYIQNLLLTVIWYILKGKHFEETFLTNIQYISKRQQKRLRYNFDTFIHRKGKLTNVSFTKERQKSVKSQFSDRFLSHYVVYVRTSSLWLV